MLINIRFLRLLGVEQVGFALYAEVLDIGLPALGNLLGRRTLKDHLAYVANAHQFLEERGEEGILLLGCSVGVVADDLGIAIDDKAEVKLMLACLHFVHLREIDTIA